MKSFVFMSVKERRLVTSSIQCLRNDSRWNAERVMHEYLRWLPRYFSPLLMVREEGDKIAISLLFRKIELLAFRVDRERSRHDRRILNIVGGILSARGNRGRFEFIDVRNGSFVFIAVREFHPRLPRLIYAWTQSKLHVLAMHAFEAHLMRRP